MFDSGEKNNLKQNGFAWLDKLRYDRSFTAKLLLSEQAVKNYYALIVGEILSYEKVRARTGWSGVGFFVGKKAFARVGISGKTLCLYLAARLEDVSSLKYKAIDAGEKRKYEKTPSAFKIKSEGGAKHAVKQIQKLAEEFSLVKKDGEGTLPFSIRSESFDNLVARGLIRVIKGKIRENPVERDKEKTTLETAPETSTESAINPPISALNDVFTAYENTKEAIEKLFNGNPFYGEILSLFAAGETSVKSNRKIILKALDETWIEKIEAALPSIDYLLRNPTHFISETEEVLPIELTRKISGRSISHLARHTDYISEADEYGSVTPTKLLNVFREDSVLTYENKFLNTLISRLYFFVTERFSAIKEKGADEKKDEVSFETRFYSGEKRGEIKIAVTLASPLSEGDNNGVKSLFGSPLFKRAERLDAVVKGYADSDFCKQLGRNFIRPPVMRTNAILKNKYFRDALELWEFIESYDDFGMGVTVGEKVFGLSKNYIDGLYGSAAMSFLRFLHETNDNSTERTVLSEYKTPLFSPKIITEQSIEKEEKYNVKLPPEIKENFDDEEVLVNVLAAVKAQKTYRELNPLKKNNEEQPEDITETEDDTLESSSGAVVYKGLEYVKDFEAKIRLADDVTKDYFIRILNAFAEFKDVKIRMSGYFTNVKYGKDRIACINMRGKTLCFFTNVLRSDAPALYEAYRLTDLSDKKKYARTPTLIKIRGNRTLKYALTLVGVLAQKYSLVKAKKIKKVYSAEDFPVTSFEELLSLGLIHKLKTAENKEDIPAADIDEKEVALPEQKSTETGDKTDVKDDLKSFEFASEHEPYSSAFSEETPPEAVLEAEENSVKESVEEEKLSYEDRTLPGIAYPEAMDYSHPSLKGVDDAKGFFADEKQSAAQSEDTDKKGVFKRIKKLLFGRKGDKR